MKHYSGFPWIARNYASSVVPVIFIIALAGQIQKPIKKLIPEMSRIFRSIFTVLLQSPLAGFCLSDQYCQYSQLIF